MKRGGTQNGRDGEQGNVVSIVAMEAGSRWPMWLDDVRLGSPQLVTVVQQSDQPLARLVSRVLQIAKDMQGRGKVCDVLAIACNTRSDRNAIIARAQIAKAVFPAMEALGGRIVLTADQRIDQAARGVLLTLARSLADGAPNPNVTVGVSFGEYTSGLWPTPDLREHAERAAQTTGFRVKEGAVVAVAAGEEE